MIISFLKKYVQYGTKLRETRRKFETEVNWLTGIHRPLLWVEASSGSERLSRLSIAVAAASFQSSEIDSSGELPPSDSSALSLARRHYEIRDFAQPITNPQAMACNILSFTRSSGRVIPREIRQLSALFDLYDDEMTYFRTFTKIRDVRSFRRKDQCEWLDTMSNPPGMY